MNKPVLSSQAERNGQNIQTLNSLPQKNFPWKFQINETYNVELLKLGYNIWKIHLQSLSPLDWILCLSTSAFIFMDFIYQRLCSASWAGLLGLVMLDLWIVGPKIGSLWEFFFFRIFIHKNQQVFYKVVFTRLANFKDRHTYTSTRARFAVFSVASLNQLSQLLLAACAW